MELDTEGSAVHTTGARVLVTARHMVNPSWICPVPDPAIVFIRLNKKVNDPKKDATGVDYIPVPLVDGEGNKMYLVRKDDFIPMRLSAFASPEEIKALRIGDPAVSAGLLPGKSGEKRNYPFFKFGNISNIPGEPVKITCGNHERFERVWFLAANLVGGNSGSPVFYDVPPMCNLPFIKCNRGLDRGIIIGVQSSSFPDPIFGSAGVAGMTPIEDVFKIIEQNSEGAYDLFRGDDTDKFRQPEKPSPPNK